MLHLLIEFAGLVWLPEMKFSLCFTNNSLLCVHEQQCHLLVGTDRHSKSVEYGINRTSILEEVPGFSVATGLPHDIMHDLFEGVVNYELKLFFLYCTSNHFFSIETLNNRLDAYDWSGR